MRVVFFSTYLLTPHYETELELMEKHIVAGDEVVHVVCNRSFSFCYANPENNEEQCEWCIKKRKVGQNMLGKAIKTIDIKNYTQKIVLPEGLTFSSIEELKKIHIQNFDIGYSVLSYLVDYTRTISPDFSKNKDSTKIIFDIALRAYYGLKTMIKEEQPDLVYVFNGRGAIEKAAIKACESVNVKYVTHERGSSKFKYEIFENTIPHDLMRKAKTYNDFWNKGTPDKVNIAKSFYESKVKRQDIGWHSYVGNQNFGKLPENWDYQKHNVIIYNSSGFESAALGEAWENKIFGNQLEAIKSIRSGLEKNGIPSDYKIYLRVHPHTVDHFHEEESILDVLDGFSGIEVISSKSDICSYALLLNSSKVITYGSTLGVEATFWGKPSILIAPTFYEELDCAYKAEDTNDLVNLILDRNLVSKPIEGALKYGYYRQSFGTSFEYYKPKTLFEGEFKGKNLNKPDEGLAFDNYYLNKMLLTVKKLR